MDVSDAGFSTCGRAVITDALLVASSSANPRKLHKQGRLLHSSLRSFAPTPRHVTLCADEGVARGHDGCDFACRSAGRLLLEVTLHVAALTEGGQNLLDVVITTAGGQS
jgi:hypothetical protein